MPANITDYRDPAKSKGRHFTYSDQARRSTGKRRGWLNAPRTHLVLTKAGGVIVYYYADHNTIEWKDLLELLHREVDPVQGDIFDLVVKGTGYLLDRSRTTGNWSGDRNRYSADLIQLAQMLLDRGVATKNTPIWIGNWAANEGEHIGTAGSIVAKNTTPRQIRLFHGTDTFRLAQIMKTGLKAMAFDDRVWNHTSLDKQRPEHRDEAVYLTASRPQAEYYAKKAVNTDRKRFGPSKRAELSQAMDHAKRTISIMTAQLASFDRMSDEQIAAQDDHSRKYDYRADTIAHKRAYYPAAIARAQAIIDRGQRLAAHEYLGKIEPVILHITLHKSEFDKLMADDDHLRQNPEAKPEDWQQSLSNFGQIAFRGAIPPDRIKVIAQGADAGQRSR